MTSSYKGGGCGRLVRIRVGVGCARPTAWLGTSDHQVDDRAHHSREHDHEHPDELAPGLEHEIVRDLDHIDDRPDPDDECGRARTRMMMTDPSEDTIDLPCGA